MLKIQNITMKLSDGNEELRSEVCRILKVSPKQIKKMQIVRRSIDARKKNDVHFTVTVEVELSAPYQRALPKNVSEAEEYRYVLPESRPLDHRPVVVGAGPAGLFAALILAMAGKKPILLERGRPVEEREQDVRKFWLTGKLDTASNVQFGEGGAGTFSDGKLNTGTKDPRGRFVLETFVECGAPEQILYDAKPHVGTDRLHETIRNLRKRILELGGDVRFGTQVIGLIREDGILRGVTVRNATGEETIRTDHAIFAIGHSARDTFEMLFGQGICMEQKPFSVGARIEHKQEWLDRAQYGAFAGHPALGAADYKLAVHTPSGRGVYTFCMCPGGTVVAAASEEGRVVTNGMSEWARDGENCNAAVLVSVDEQDFGSAHPLAGMKFQRELEEAAFRAGGGDFCAPAQLVGDFLAGRDSTGLGAVQPTYSRGVKLTNLGECLPIPILGAMREGIRMMDRYLHGFANEEAVLTGVESRSSSPVRMVRGEETGCSVSVPGLYPCGEGAGYAGGIMSAATDGIRCAEAVLRASMR